VVIGRAAWECKGFFNTFRKDGRIWDVLPKSSQGRAIVLASHADQKSRAKQGSSGASPSPNIAAAIWATRKANGEQEHASQ